MERTIKNLNEILGPGLNPQDLSFGQLLLRALIIGFVMNVLVRLAGGFWP
jgi:hypothetical protein